MNTYVEDCKEEDGVVTALMSYDSIEHLSDYDQVRFKAWANYSNGCELNNEDFLFELKFVKHYYELEREVQNANPCKTKLGVSALD